MKCLPLFVAVLIVSLGCPEARSQFPPINPQDAFERMLSHMKETHVKCDIPYATAENEVRTFDVAAEGVTQYERFATMQTLVYVSPHTPWRKQIELGRYLLEHGTEPGSAKLAGVLESVYTDAKIEVIATAAMGATRDGGEGTGLGAKCGDALRVLKRARIPPNKAMLFVMQQIWSGKHPDEVCAAATAKVAREN